MQTCIKCSCRPTDMLSHLDTSSGMPTCRHAHMLSHLDALRHALLAARNLITATQSCRHAVSSRSTWDMLSRLHALRHLLSLRSRIYKHTFALKFCMHTRPQKNKKLTHILVTHTRTNEAPACLRANWGVYKGVQGQIELRAFELLYCTILSYSSCRQFYTRHTYWHTHR